MKIEKIIKYSKKPKIYTPGTSVMWTDKHISKQLLKVHLNAEIDLASRKKNTIEKTVNWILDKTEKKPLKILDLGCGPGLYCEIFAQKGHQVTGVDFSKNSIEFARKQALEKQLDIEYINENYLQLDLAENRFEIIIMIYTDYCVLNPNERKQLLSIIKKGLNPGGMFIFDFNKDIDLEKKIIPKSWEVSKKGFWKNKPYLVFSESFLYKKEKVILYQHIVTDEEKDLKVYRFYTHFFSEKEIKNELSKGGFSSSSFHENVLPEGDLWNGGNVIFCIVYNSK